MHSRKLLLGLLRRGTILAGMALAVAWAAGLFSAAPGPAGQGALGAAASGAMSTEQRFVPAVEDAFNGLSRRGDALMFNRRNSPAATLCKHYQGVARKDAPDGTPYLILTKSGNQPFSICPGDDEPGYLIVARMSSRDKTGERLRTNLLPSAGEVEVNPNLAIDEVVTVIPFDGEPGPPAYRHPGGMQILGDILAIGVENTFGGPPFDVRATILFFDVSNPEQPRYLSRFDPELDNFAFGADPVGLTAIKTADGACCRYLMIVAGGPGNDNDEIANGEVRFFRSRPDPDKTTTDLVSRLESGDAVWEEVGRYTEAELEACPGVGNWPTGTGTQHQMFNFVREGDLDGPLFLVAALRDGAIDPFTHDDERVDLYQVHLTAEGAPKTCPLTLLGSKIVGPATWGEGKYFGSFAAGSSVYVSPSGELIVYVSHHFGRGAPDFFSPTNDFVTVSEFRHHNVVRANSPTLHPTASVGGPFAVDEGSSVQLTGQGEPPITKAFIQLFNPTGAGSTGLFDGWLIVDYPDRHADLFDDLSRLKVLGGIWDKASSWRWFAPPGCTIQANDFPITSVDFPGDDTVVLRGTGQLEEVQDLSGLRVYQPVGSTNPYPVSPVPAGQTGVPKPRVDNDVEGVTFYEAYRVDGTLVRDHRGCESYYNASIGLGWDLDGNGSFEASGSPVSFSAANLDGPTTATVQGRATHPTDTSPLGVGVPLPVPVEVRNVAPRIESAEATDSLGHDVGTPGTFVLAGLPLRLEVTFTDPGLADTQTAAVDWGDGTVDTTFDTYSDARSGALGLLRDAHTFAAAGTYDIVTTITDDDGGVTPATVRVEVLSPADAIEEIGDELSDLINGATDPGVADALRHARDELIGNHGGTPPTNGALDKLDVDDPVGAITKIRAAISYLEQAESLGAGDLSAMKGLLGLVAEAIATGAYHDAQAAVAPPSPGEARTLATIAGLIALGDQKLSGGQYLSACDSFRQATAKALKLSS